MSLGGALASPALSAAAAIKRLVHRAGLRADALSSGELIVGDGFEMTPDYALNQTPQNGLLGHPKHSFLVKAPVGIFAGAVSGWLRARPSVLTWVYRCSGANLVGLRVRLALERR